MKISFDFAVIGKGIRHGGSLRLLISWEVSDGWLSSA
jgi:hypothetical protein